MIIVLIAVHLLDEGGTASKFRLEAGPRPSWTNASKVRFCSQLFGPYLIWKVTSGHILRPQGRCHQ